jgi:hypothetical protein
MEFDEETREMMARLYKTSSEIIKAQRAKEVLSWESVETEAFDDETVEFFRAVETDGGVVLRATVGLYCEFVVHNHDIFEPTPYVIEYYRQNPCEFEHVTTKFSYMSYPTYGTFHEAVMWCMSKRKKHN